MTFLNADRFIREAIDSVVAQTYQNWELILVNDGSSDASASIALSYAEKAPGTIQCVSHPRGENRGISASRNLGIRHARGKYVAFLDADDLWFPSKLSEQTAIFLAKPDVEMIYGLTQYWYSWTGAAEDLKRDHIPDLGVSTDVVFTPPKLLLLLYPLGQATAPSMSDILVTRELLTRVGGFEEEFKGMYEDQAFLVKAYLHGNIFVSTRCWDRYRIHPDSCLSQATEQGRYEAVRMYFLRWFQGYLRARSFTDPAVLDALQNAIESRRTVDEVVHHYGGWLFRVAAGNQARFVAPNGDDVMRIAIDRCGTATPHDIQLNQSRLRVREGQRGAVTFQARADRARAISIGVAQASQPWKELGLYAQVDLTPDWQDFREEFTATGTADNARILFDLGGDGASVEIRSVRLLSLPNDEVIHPDLPQVNLEAMAGNTLPLPVPGDLGSRPIHFGDFRRVVPIAKNWGYDRGMPVDRYYIEKFLARNAEYIRGRVLEIEDNTYTRRFGGDQVTRYDALHVEEGYPQASIVADLSDAPQIPSNSFDCIILTQTLQLIFDLRATIRTVHRILKPGGVVLATIPGITQTNDRDWSTYWYWSFTPLAGRRLFEEAFKPDGIHIDIYGNILAAISLLHGLAAEELTEQELAFTESGYEVTIGLRAMKEESSS